MSTAGGDKREFSAALVELRSRQKTSKGAPAYSLLINRRLGRVFAAMGYVIGATPNQVTMVSAAFTFSAVMLIALVNPTPTVSIATLALLVIGYALDAADGQLARLLGGGSVAGEWLDHLVDSVKIVALHGAVLISWYRFGGRGELWLLVPLAYLMVASVLFFIIILNDQLRRAHKGTTGMILQGDGSSSRVYSLALIPTDYGFLCLTFGLTFWTRGFTLVYSLLMVANAAFLVLALFKWFREVRAY